MDKTSFLKPGEIPTIRRLDYIVQGMQMQQRGKLYGVLRDMIHLDQFNDTQLSESAKEIKFKNIKSVIIPQMERVNQLMKQGRLFPIFSDMDDYHKVGEDYDYFWCLRGENQFAQEEADARLGTSGRKSTPNIPKEFEEMIEKKMQELKRQHSDIDVPE